jgi:hypothetical protein
VAASAFSAPSFGQDAKEINDRVTTINDSLVFLSSSWASQLREVSLDKKQSYSDLKSLRKQLEEYITVSVEEVKGMRDAGGSEQLRIAELAFLEFEKNLVTTYFTPFEHFNGRTSNDEITDASRNVQSKGREERGLMMEMTEKKKAFMEMNHLAAAPVYQGPQKRPVYDNVPFRRSKDYKYRDRHGEKNQEEEGQPEPPKKSSPPIAADPRPSPADPRQKPAQKVIPKKSNIQKVDEDKEEKEEKEEKDKEDKEEKE